MGNSSQSAYNNCPALVEKKKQNTAILGLWKQSIILHSSVPSETVAYSYCATQLYDW